MRMIFCAGYFAEDSDGFVHVQKPTRRPSEPEVEYKPHSPRVGTLHSSHFQIALLPELINFIHYFNNE